MDEVVGTDPGPVAALLRRRSETSDLWLSTSGDSMGRAIPNGARVHVRRSSGPPRIGEVWAFVGASGLVTVHRYVRRRRDGTLVFVGDAADGLDPPIHAAWTIGRVDVVRDGMTSWTPGRGALIRPIGRAARRRLRRRREDWIRRLMR